MSISVYDNMPEFIGAVLHVFHSVNKKAEKQKDKRLHVISLVIFN